jgi:hypothetical protein
MPPFRNVSAAASDGAGPLERFKPTNGLFIGWAGLATVAFALAYTAIYVHSVVGLRIGLGALFAGVVIWVSQLRPRATAYPDVLQLRGALRDVHVPYLLIDEVAMGQTLNVWAGGRRYVCIGIGKSLGTDVRQRAKKERQGSLLGSSRQHEFSERAEAAAPDQRAMDYQTFVVTRIEELLDEARRDRKLRPDRAVPSSVRQTYAVPELVALGVTGLAFVASLFI